MTSHDLDDRHGFFVVVNGCVDGDLTNGGRNIFCGASESRRMIGEHEIVVDRFRDSDEPDVAFDRFRIAGKLADCVHGIVAADIEKVADIFDCKFFKQLRIDRIVQIFRQLVAAGSEVGSGSCFDQFQFAGLFQRFHIHDLIVQESLDSVDHSVDRSECVFAVQCFIYNAVQTGIDDRSRSAGLSDNYIFLLHEKFLRFV